MCKNYNYITMRPHYVKNGLKSSQKNYQQLTTHEAFLNGDAIAVDCGKCYECKNKKSMLIKLKMLLEAKHLLEKYEDASIYFVTLTFNEDNIKKFDISKPLREFQLMLKRLRKKNNGVSIKYLVSLELGTKTFRPHYHAIIYASKNIIKERSNFKLIKKNNYFSSNDLTWTNGFNSIVDITTDKTRLTKQELFKNIKRTLNYVTKYIQKNPLAYSYSKRLAYDYIYTHADLSKLLWYYNGKTFKLPYYKNFNSIDDIILNNRISYTQKQTKTNQGENLTHAQEPEEW